MNSPLIYLLPLCTMFKCSTTFAMSVHFWQRQSGINALLMSLILHQSLFVQSSYLWSPAVFIIWSQQSED